MRTEQDNIGKMSILGKALYGIHAARARENFPYADPFHIEWYQATGLIKKAFYITYSRFSKAIQEHRPQSGFPLIANELIIKMTAAAGEVAEGKWYSHFIVPATQGGAGTSINMNINEIIANRALRLMGYEPGNTNIVDPIEHANIYQSTNDVMPSALKIASMLLLTGLEKGINRLRGGVEELEKKYRDVMRVGYTQMQEAVPSSYGRFFGNYNEALSRDWWRVSRCSERLKTLNIGGSAIGTSIAVPRFFVFETIKSLKELTRLPVARGEHLTDTTSNLDAFVEVHAILKAHAVNLEKMVSDMRLLASGVMGQNEMELPSCQTGSSVMPGKINPVIPEYVISIANKVYANDQMITSLCAGGCLDLNAYLPAIGNALLESLKLLIAAGATLFDNMLSGLVIKPERSEEKLFKSPAISTVLLPEIGYHKAVKLANAMKEEGIDIFAANKKLQLLKKDVINKLLKKDNILKQGFTL